VNKNNYTSLELSQKLIDSGCKLIALNYYVKDVSLILPTKKGGKFRKKEFIRLSSFMDEDEKSPPAYDILNDICVKYAKEFFGKDDGIDDPFEYSKRGHTERILGFLQQDKKQDAEDYIWEHCLFNPKNK
jgi:hypothetical protein